MDVQNLGVADRVVRDRGIRRVTDIGAIATPGGRLDRVEATGLSGLRTVVREPRTELHLTDVGGSIAELAAALRDGQASTQRTTVLGLSVASTGTS